MEKVVRLFGLRDTLDEIDWYVFVVERVRYCRKNCTSLSSKGYPL